jgi:hypothetical protein
LASARTTLRPTKPDPPKTVTRVSRFDAMGPFPRGQSLRDRSALSRFAIRQRARAVQRNWAASKQFDKRATDPY